MRWSWKGRQSSPQETGGKYCCRYKQKDWKATQAVEGKAFVGTQQGRELQLGRERENGSKNLEDLQLEAERFELCVVGHERGVDKVK